MIPTYEWSFKDYPAKKNGLKVFTTFSCGGGSSMGYKLAGYDVIAANDIDVQMKQVYKANHNPKYYLLGGVKDLLNQELPQDLYDIDLLDGSPPCSVFSMVGAREKGWGKDKMFREGQSKQVLDDLFFDFIALVDKIEPKLVIAENVEGMLFHHAKWYTREVHRRMNEIGYTGQVFLLNGATMGLPQQRKRVFFIYHRNDLKLPKLTLSFNKTPIMYKDIRQDSGTKLENTTDLYKQYWQNAKRKESVGKFKQVKKVAMYQVPYTLTAGQIYFDALQPRKLYLEELLKISSFPRDYNFLKIKPNYLMGMSVPPLMMYEVANEVYKQWGSRIKSEQRELEYVSR